MSKLIFVTILSVFILGIDYYLYQAIKFATISYSEEIKKLIHLGFKFLTIITFSSFFLLQFTSLYSFPKWVTNYIVAPLLMIFIAKIIVALILLLGDIWRGGKWSFSKLFPATEFDPSRSNFITNSALILGGIMGTTFLYGIAKGAFNYTIHNEKLSFPNFPKAFNGLKIVQISDLHVGSFVSERPLEKAVEIINSQNADIVLFTGDLVNNMSKEAVPFTETLKKIKAKHGVYSVLGNHDYGDYHLWDENEAKNAKLKAEDVANLIQIQSNMGWKVLMDENITFEKDGEQFSLIGIQNWGAKARFPKYGNLKKAYENTDKSPFKILMSHDPSHWKAEVTKLYKDIDLMLSGHTHGFQFGIDIPGFIQWSPVKYVYNEWAGLYKEGNQHLYVNRGLGFLGYPGRVGISPEITVLEFYNS